MNNGQKIVINDEEYNFGDLKVETQAHIARVSEIRGEIARLQQRLAENQVLLQAYTQSIVEGVQPVEQPETAQGLPDNFKEH